MTWLRMVKDNNQLVKNAAGEGHRPDHLILSIMVFLIVCLLQWFMLEISVSKAEMVLRREVFRTLISFSIVIFFNAILLLAAGSAILPQTISAILSTFLSVLNCYMIQLHGSPFRFSELRSLLTAKNVLDRYSLKLPPKINNILILLVIELVLIMFSYFSGTKQRKRSYARPASCILLCSSAAVVLYGFLSPAWRPVIGWSWKASNNDYGYPAFLLEDSLRLINRFEKPNGYSEEEINRICNSAGSDLPVRGEWEKGKYPDIVLILNETFYDPSVYEPLKLNTDLPYLDYFYSLKGVTRGYNAVPLEGTNKTEYELLTSNSSVLINLVAPFNYMYLGEQNSIVNYLKNLGYSTAALHNAENDNYSRNFAYPALGFEKILFYSDFLPETYYGNRRATDSHDYELLKETYEKAGDSPRFIYILTIQNHGGYEQNPEEYDTIHVLGDYGEITDDINEFLTSVSMSDSALKELLEYFSSVERDVFVVMTGDHPPVFVSDYNKIGIPEGDDEKEYIKGQMTPYIIWSNHKELTADYPYITCSDLVPMTLKAAGIPLSPYYRQILRLQEEYPVHLKGNYFDVDGNFFSSADGTSGSKVLDDYLYMEYNNLLSPDDRKDSLFKP